MQGKDELLSVLLDVGKKTTHTFKDFSVFAPSTKRRLTPQYIICLPCSPYKSRFTDEGAPAGF